MAIDRALDRHRTGNYPYRPSPPDLLERLDAAVGPGRRSEILSALLSAYLDGGPMPTPPALPKPSRKSGDTGQSHGAQL